VKFEYQRVLNQKTLPDIWNFCKYIHTNQFSFYIVKWRQKPVTIATPRELCNFTPYPSAFLPNIHSICLIEVTQATAHNTWGKQKTHTAITSSYKGKFKLVSCLNKNEMQLKYSQKFWIQFNLGKFLIVVLGVLFVYTRFHIYIYTCVCLFVLFEKSFIRIINLNRKLFGKMKKYFEYMHNWKLSFREYYISYVAPRTLQASSSSYSNSKEFIKYTFNRKLIVD
jgi:hypothetical protein